MWRCCWRTDDTCALSQPETAFPLHFKRHVAAVFVSIYLISIPLRAGKYIIFFCVVNQPTQTTLPIALYFFFSDRYGGRSYLRQKKSTVNDPIALIMLPFSIKFSERWQWRPPLLVSPTVKFTCQKIIFLFFSNFHHVNCTAIGIICSQVEKKNGKIRFRI